MSERSVTIWNLVVGFSIVSIIAMSFKLFPMNKKFIRLKDRSADLQFGTDKELENIPGKYKKPDGCIILACKNSDSIGCVGMRPLDGITCEIKRLYIKPDYRGFGLGKLLTKKVLEYCIERGYIKVFLDTTSSMESAINIYKSLGFLETSPYYNNPLSNVIFFELNLDNERGKK